MPRGLSPARLLFILLVGTLVASGEERFEHYHLPPLSQARIDELTVAANNGDLRAAGRLYTEFASCYSGRAETFFGNPEAGRLAAQWGDRFRELQVKFKREAGAEWSLAKGSVAAGDHGLALYHFRAADALAGDLVHDQTPERVVFNMDYAECLAALNEVSEALSLARRAEATVGDAFEANDPQRARASALVSGLRARLEALQR